MDQKAQVNTSAFWSVILKTSVWIEQKKKMWKSDLGQCNSNKKWHLHAVLHDKETGKQRKRSFSSHSLSLICRHAGTKKIPFNMINIPSRHLLRRVAPILIHIALLPFLFYDTTMFFHPDVEPMRRRAVSSGGRRRRKECCRMLINMAVKPSGDYVW